jgi:hypothetical protein
MRRLRHLFAIFVFVSMTLEASAQVNLKTEGECSPAISAGANVTFDCSSGNGDADLIYDMINSDCVKMGGQVERFFSDAIEWRMLRPVMLPKLNESLRAGLVENSKALYKRKKEGFADALKAASDLKESREEIRNDRASPWMTYNMSLYLTSIQKICRWTGVEVKMKPDIARYESEIGMRIDGKIE